MFADNDACSRSFTSLTMDEIRWLNASQAFDDGDSVHSLPAADLVKSHSIAVPKSSRPRLDTRRRSILLDDFLGLSRSADNARSRFGLTPRPNLADTPPPSPDELLPVTPPRAGSYSTGHSSPGRTILQEMPPLPQRPMEWLYRRPKSPSTLSRSPSTLSKSPSCISRSSSDSRSVTPTPTRIRPPTGYRPRTPTPAVAEMNQSPFWSTVVPPQRSPSVRTGSPSSHGSRTPSSPSRSSPNLLDFRASPRAQKLVPRPKLLPVQRERSGSQSSSVSTTSTSSLPRTPPSPSIYSQHSFNYPHPDTRSTTPTKSILTLTPKRSPSISTKHSSGSKSVTFDEVPAIRYTVDRVHVGDGKVRGEEWNSHTVDGGVDCMGFDMEGMDLLEGRGTQTPTPLAKNHSGSLKRFLTLRRNKSKPRPEISGPYALAPSSPSSPPQPSLSQSQLSSGLTPSSSFKSKSSSFLVQGNVGVIPSSPNGGTDLGFSPRYKPKKSSSLIGPGDPGVLPDHGRFLSNKFYSHPTRLKTPKASSITGSGSIGLLASEPVLHALPSMESFRSERSAKSTRSCGRFKDWLGRIGIGVTA
ncbi:hypothetical protein B0H12DRAFT_266063 [Mycena haematopus]|nr:hypothetical protein B0H12DRAFT_266063 [Mycena haematopus]